MHVYLYTGDYFNVFCCLIICDTYFISYCDWQKAKGRKLIRIYLKEQISITVESMNTQSRRHTIKVKQQFCGKANSYDLLK